MQEVASMGLGAMWLVDEFVSSGLIVFGSTGLVGWGWDGLRVGWLEARAEAAG